MDVRTAKPTRRGRRTVVLLIFALGLILIYFVASRHLSLDAVAVQEDRLRSLVARYPAASWLIGFAVYLVASLVPGTGGKAFVFGWLFGFLPALVIVNFGLTAAALISFLVVRHAFQAAVHRRLGKLIRRIDAALLREGGLYLLTLRLLHVPYTITNYAAGATTVRTRTFWWTTQLGLLPGNVVLVLAGSQVPSLRQWAQQGPWDLIDFPLLLSLSLAALAPVFIRSTVRKWRDRSKEGTDRASKRAPS
jgi:uncharacterized membrane protein YdjX (TVP38/TMEM64 family)